MQFRRISSRRSHSYFRHRNEEKIIIIVVEIAVETASMLAGSIAVDRPPIAVAALAGATNETRARNAKRQPDTEALTFFLSAKNLTNNVGSWKL